MHCQAVNSLVPYLKKGIPPKVPVANFFLRDLDGKYCIIFALVVYGIYGMCNKFRHSTDHSDLMRSCEQLLMFLLGLGLPSLGRSVFCGHIEEQLDLSMCIYSSCPGKGCLWLKQKIV